MTDVVVITGDVADISPPAGFTRINVDLNAGAGGKYIFLCYKSGDSENAITALQVSVCHAVQSALHMQS